ncbi:hypothetical protein [Ferrimonas lipolytica]|uniref:Uncharacterized protein n=1 Tax=Ferrimonas lipolytica TaxID=2724191 RepID=A0A6H1UHJ6_9GAMM|nr:hypothetical protein [Ferrimonas lipolytica]QIZ77262.1 hypothetical protein HER31_10455 [Ferrimonas lipolytica]
MNSGKLTALVLPLLLGLTACGNDDAEIPTQSNTPAADQNPAWSYIETPEIDFSSYDSTLKGTVEVTVGRVVDNVQPWLTAGMLRHAMVGQGYADNLLYENEAGEEVSYDANGDGNVNIRDATDAGVSNTEIGPIYDVDMEQMKAWLATNPDGLGAGTSRPDIFVDGHYNVFDLLRYVVGTRDDMRWEGGVENIIKPADSEYDTYEFHISWDRNGDGDFSECIDEDLDDICTEGVDTDADGEYFDSEHWHFGFIQSRGENRMYGGLRHDYNYKRMDQFWLREAQQIRFLPHDEVLTNRRHWVWKQEQERLANNDGKYVVPYILHAGSRDMGIQEFLLRADAPEIKEMDVEVKAWNLRSDVFQPGVITSMDVWLSLAEARDLDFRFTWWRVLSSGAIVNNFALMHDPWSGPYDGWIAANPYQGELAAAEDFAMIPTPRCDFKHDGTPTEKNEGEIDDEICQREFQSFLGIGGNNLGEVAGANIIRYPPEYMALIALQSEELFYIDDIILNEDKVVEVRLAENELQRYGMDGVYDFDKFPEGEGIEVVTETATLRPLEMATTESKIGNAPIVDETHFGWKIADCSQCHNDEKNSLGHGGQSWPTNTTDGFDNIQPYYCATCHGNNGAPEAHNRSARCFWCHNTYNDDGGMLMKNHGDASLAKFVPAEENVSNLRTASTHPQYTDRDTKLAQQTKLYEDMWFSSHNSDYSLSKTFPDPYACGTCHGFQREIDK